MSCISPYIAISYYVEGALSDCGGPQNSSCKFCKHSSNIEGARGQKIHYNTRVIGNSQKTCRRSSKQQLQTSALCTSRF